MSHVRNLTDTRNNDVNIAGGKGASLGEMKHAGIKVPDGFVILAIAFEKFLSEGQRKEKIAKLLCAVDVQDTQMINETSEKIQKLILDGEIPKDICSSILQNYKTLGAEYVAVRSSATAEDSASAAWAGQLDTFLNTTEDHLLENVKKCWASLFTPRAIFYRRRHAIENGVSVAVVVQKMVQSEVSGVAFSVHPVTEDRNQMIIEAGFGLGEAIVSGQITPDTYVIQKSLSQIIDKSISTQTRSLIRADGGIGNEWLDVPEPKASSQVLSDKHIIELAGLVLRIESHYDFPCDIEWAMEKGTFYIIQSRPITTLSKRS